MNVTLIENLIGGSVKVSMWDRTADGRMFVFGPGRDSYVVTDEAIQIPDEYFWTIPGQALKPLTQALKAHLGETTDDVIRKDFEKEQKRVDQFIDYLTKESG
jgi:hypothetical protein